MDDPRVKILIISISILVAGGLIAGVVGYKMDTSSVAGESEIATMQLDSTRYDFGDIKIDGGLVKHVFEIKNTGPGELKLSNIETSCMCTSAYLEVNGQKSPKFGMASHGTNPTFWSEKIVPGQTGTLEIIFDPMAHGPDAIGPVTRVVSVYSNNGGKSNVKTEFVFTANVIR